MKKLRNTSQQRSVEHYDSLRPVYERKCQTPSQQPIYSSKNKSKSRERSKTKGEPSSTRYVKQHQYSQQPILSVGPILENKKASPFKHKSRPISNLANAKYARNIEAQLSYLNDSIMNVYSSHSAYHDLSTKKSKHDSSTHSLLEQAKSAMKVSDFARASSCLVKLMSAGEQLEAKYLLGVCHFHMDQHEEAISLLTQVLAKDEQYRKNVYLFLSISLKKLGMIEEAIVTLTKAIKYYPKYHDAIFLRGKLLCKRKRLYDAIVDFQTCLKLDPKNLQPAVSKADSLRALQKYEDAITIYSQLLAVKIDPQLLIKRAITYIEIGLVMKSLADLNMLIDIDKSNPQAYLFKGIVFTKTKNLNEAILCFQQTIKFNTDRKATTKALYELAKIKIDTGDFYGASYTIERAASLDADLKILERLRMFTDAVTLIMKKKFKKGIELITTLTKRQHLSDQIRPLLLSFRAYGYFCQYRFLNALNDLKTLTKLSKLDSASQYNYALLEGILHSQNGQFDEATGRFSYATELMKNFNEPLVYRALNQISQFNRSNNKDAKRLREALSFLSKALEREKNDNFYYLAACVLYTLGRHEEALANIEQAIEKSEDHVIKHYYLRGLIKGSQRMIKESLVDFSNVVGLINEAKQKQREATLESEESSKAKDIPEVYLQRAKCFLLLEDKKKAFQALQTYIAEKPLDGDIHGIAGRLLSSIGAWEDAIKAYNYCPGIDKNKEFLLERAKCYASLKQLNCCLKDLERLIEIGDTKAKIDFCCLSGLKEASQGEEKHAKQAYSKLLLAQQLCSKQGGRGHIFSQSDITFYRGIVLVYLGQYEESQKALMKAKNLKLFHKEISSDGIFDLNQDNGIFDYNQLCYNIAVVQLLQGKAEQARNVLQRYEKFGNFFQNKAKGVFDLTPFQTTNKLSSIFGEIRLSEEYYIRFSFCLPSVVPPAVTFEIEPRIISELGMNSIEPRPDGPWIKRNAHGVIFTTDELVSADIDICTEKSLDRKDIDQQHEGSDNRLDIDPLDERDTHDFQGNESLSGAIAYEPQPHSNDFKARMKDMFAFDSGVQERLQRILKRENAKSPSKQ